jgi:hypothetical protein
MEEKYLEIDLPSKGLVYAGIDTTKIGIRTFKGKDEKLMADLNFDNFERRILTILRSVLKGIDPAVLTTGDRLYILIWEAINSYSKDYKTEGDCLNCFQKVTIPVDLSQLEVINLPEDFKEPYPLILSTGEIVNLKLFRVDDEVKIADYEKSSGQSSWLFRFATTIVNDKGIWDKINWLENLPAKDVAAIRAFQEKFTHGPKLETNYTCPKCGGTGVMPVPFRLQIFFPYGEILKGFA